MATSFTSAAKKTLRIGVRATGIGIGIGILSVIALRWIPPITTPLQVWRFATAVFDNRTPRLVKDWISYEEVSPHLLRAVIVTEDRKFLRHHGIDWDAVDHARRVNPSRVRRGKPPLGASTITMQTARNVYLLPFRFFVRKVLEAGLAYAIDAVWGKKRVLEMYVNVIEWGDGIYGVQAAARAYFKKDASALSRKEAALLAAVIQNPRRFHADRPSPYVKRRAAGIQSRMGGAALPQ